MKLHLFGASGSGVTTLGKALANKLCIPYFDSDDYYWVKTDPPFTKKRAPEERNKLLLSELAKTDDWILGGSVFTWGENLFPKFDLNVFLYLPQSVRMERLKKREFQRYGAVIYTDPGRKKWSEDFLAWAADYDEGTGISTRTLQFHQQCLSKINEKVLEIKGDFTTEERTIRIIKVLQQDNLLRI